MAAMKWLLLAGLSLLATGCGSQSSDPTVLPSWITAYPGSSVQHTASAFVFRTTDPTEKIIDFYERQLEQKGVHKEARGGGEYGGFLSAADDSHTRNVMIEVRPDKGAFEVTITPVEKK